MKYLLTIMALLSMWFFSCKPAADSVVAIQPIGAYPARYVDSIRFAIQNYYNYETIVLKPITLKKSFFINVKSPRYRADSIIRYLRATKPDSIDYIMGFTSVDISTTKRDRWGKIKQPEHKYTDWGIFGLGFRPGPSCVVSDFRIKGTNELHTLQRLKKICLHELGHNFGLPHCENKTCFMRDAAESIKTIDQVELNLCEKCKSRVH